MAAARKPRVVRRISRESAVPAYDLTPWQRLTLETVWKTRRFYDAGGLLHFVIPYSVKDTLLESPPNGYEYKLQVPKEFSDSIISTHVDSYDNEKYYLYSIETRKQRAGSVSEIAPKKPRSEKPPKTARLRNAIGNKLESGKRERFPVVQISTQFATVEDIDEKPPKGFRTPKGAIAKIVTERGIQYIYPAGYKTEGLGDLNYINTSIDRGSYDVRTLKKGRTKPGKINSRRLVPIGEGREKFRGKKGLYRKVFNAIARAFKAGGGIVK